MELHTPILRAGALFLAAVAAGCATAPAVPPGPLPIADAHTHYNWNQSETISPKEVVALLDRENVVLVVASSTPSERVLELKRADPKGRVVALFSPYLTPLHRYTWFNTPAVLERAREGLASGQYDGIGEVHLIAGMPPRRDTPLFRGLTELAREFDVPLQLHAEGSDPAYVIPLCRRLADLRLVWAHAGGVLPADAVAEVMEACPDLLVDLSARDPWRFVRNPITRPDGLLLPAWDALVRRWPERFMVGSDALWPVEQMHGWEQADTGWQRLGEFLDFHRRWLAALPDGVAEAVRVGNALRFYRRAH